MSTKCSTRSMIRAGCVAGLVLLLACPVARAAWLRRKSGEAAIPGLVQDLGAAKWAKREQAQQQLIRMGEEHLDAVLRHGLETLVSSKDPEILFRTRAVVEQLVGAYIFQEERGFLGVTLSHLPVTVELDGRSWKAIEITEVFADSAAEKHGIKAGSRILEIDGHTCGPQFGVKEIVEHISNKKPGSTIMLVCSVENRKTSNVVTLGVRPWFPNDPPIEVRRKAFVDEWLMENLVKTMARLGVEKEEKPGKR
ncbi:MAG: PDZ domain-containing protein [Kiritimatiellae bacterium]|nr:PDZ domain-containing protein [Kiritimatiellia bacterium]